jgi:hypothetical protein
MLLLVVLGIGQTFRRLEEEELFFLIKDVHIFHISTKVQFLYKYHVFKYNEIGQGKLNLQHQHMITLKF